jgi:hypothetical protein
MKAGRELNELIAEKVMGWRYVTFPDGAMPHVKHWHGPSDECLLPDYSGSMNAAWQVVEKFRRGCNGKVAACIEVVTTDIANDVDTYCKIYGPDTAEVIEWANAAPVAICLAALRAVGHAVS